MSPISPPCDPLGQLLHRTAVPRHQPDADLEVFLTRLFGEFQHLAGRRAVRGQWLFHEDVEPLLDGVAEMQPAKSQRRGEDRNVARLQAVHRLLVGVEADELTLLGHIDPIAERPLDVAIAAVEAILEYVGHGHQLDRAAVDRHGIASRATAAAAAADQGYLDRVVFGSMNVRDHRGCQGRGGGHAAGVLQKFSAGNKVLASGLHWWAPNRGEGGKCDYTMLARKKANCSDY